MKKTYYSCGKLMLTGEYLVLKGAISIALPTKMGQFLEIEAVPIANNTSQITWIAYDHNEQIWLQTTIDTQTFEIIKGNSHKSIKLAKILNEIFKLNSLIFNKTVDYQIITRLEFNPNWGLGSSSTLIANLAKWAKVDPYLLLKNTLGGSGYDVAVAMQKNAITYQLTPTVQIKKIVFKPAFKNKLFFVYLNQKRDSSLSLKTTDWSGINIEVIKEINSISNAILTATSFHLFEKLIKQHEQLIANTLGMQTIKSQLFKDYPNAIKSLGAWGGDFILATGTLNDRNYFIEKGYNTILSYDEMIL